MSMDMGMSVDMNPRHLTSELPLKIRDFCKQTLGEAPSFFVEVGGGLDAWSEENGSRLPKLLYGALVVCEKATEHIARRYLGPWGKSLCVLTCEYSYTVGREDGTLPTIENAVKVAKLTQVDGVDKIICFGSGSLNDICKCAASITRKPYYVFATAPSMNGYLSPSASILTGGAKTSLAVNAPRGLFIDREVISNAPARLIASGLGDALSRQTAQSDWHLSHIVKGTSYLPEVFDVLLETERFILERLLPLVEPSEPSEPSDVGGGGAERGAIRAEGQLTENARMALQMIAPALMENLVLSGVGMYICGGSFPASGGEHAISHYLEKKNPLAMSKYYHGEHVAVTTLTMMRVQRSVVDGLSNTEELYTEGGYSALYDKLCGARLCHSLEHDTMARLYRCLGMPSLPEDIGILPYQYLEAVAHAHEIRDRFGFLNIYNLTNKY